ncbi:MAG: 30S ribosome-binding factor RbfA [Candidatus Edwardsbacteria bacterium]
MHYKRSVQVSEVLKREISEIITNSLQDPRIGFVTITEVTLSDDLRYAKVYLSILGSPESEKETLKGLKSARGYIRKLIGEHLGLRYTPEISFHLDRSITDGAHIDELLKEIRESE